MSTDGASLTKRACDCCSGPGKRTRRCKHLCGRAKRQAEPPPAPPACVAGAEVAASCPATAAAAAARAWSVPPDGAAWRGCSGLLALQPVGRVSERGALLLHALPSTERDQQCADERDEDAELDLDDLVRAWLEHHAREDQHHRREPEAGGDRATGDRQRDRARSGGQQRQRNRGNACREDDQVGDRAEEALAVPGAEVGADARRFRTGSPPRSRPRTSSGTAGRSATPARRSRRSVDRP